MLFLLAAPIVRGQSMTDASVNTNWEAYNVLIPTPPNLSYDWKRVADPVNWGTPIRGSQSSQQEDRLWKDYDIAQPKPPLSWLEKTGSATQYIWGVVDSSTPSGLADEAYFRYVFDLDMSTSRAQYILKFNGDDEVTVWVNGDPVGSTVVGWQTGAEFNISSYLVCGQNLIAVKTEETLGTAQWFLADLKAEAIDFSTGGLTYEVDDCDQAAKILLLHAPDASSYEWKDPSGNIISTLQNPVITPVNELQSGVYTCTYTIGCWTGTYSLSVTIGSDCCTASVDIVESGCQSYILALSNDMVENACVRWNVDGTNLTTHDPQLTLTLDPGSHMVCASYLGTQTQDMNEVCCRSACISFETPDLVNVVQDQMTLEICQNESHYGFEPCNYSNGATSYEINAFPYIPGSPYDYDSRVGYNDTTTGLWVSGCIWHALIPGTYEIRYYDDNGCLTKILSVTVTVVEC